MNSKVPVLVRRAPLIFFFAMILMMLGPIVFGSQATDKSSVLEFELTDIEGNSWSSEDLKGEVVVFNFWFTACAPCKKEIPELNRLVDYYSDKNVVFIGVSLNGAEEVEGFTYMHAFKYKLIPNGADFIDAHKVSSFPTQFIVGKDGKLVNRIVGRVSFEYMKELIDKII